MTSPSAATSTSTTAASAPPANANSECVGPASETAGKNSACEGCPNQSACSTGAFNSPEAKAKAQQETQALKASLSNVSHVILVLSGKGGVGKSTIAAQLCHTLAVQGFAVGLLDVDLCGPSAPRMVLGDAYATAEVHKSGSGAWTPVYSPHSANLAVMSISFLLESNDAAVVWRGPRKNALISQFLTEVDWTGDTDGLDYLIIDTPPGTSDEHISTVQYLQKAGAVSGAVVVSTPEEVSLADVRKELNFCQKTKVPVLGVVENMGSLQMPLAKLKFLDGKSGQDKTNDVLKELHEKCPQLLDMIATTELFKVHKNNDNNNNNIDDGVVKKGVELMAEQYNVPYWGSLPLDADLLKCCEEGKSVVEGFPNSIASKTLTHFASRLTKALPVEMGK